MKNSSMLRINMIGVGILAVSLLVSCTNRTVPPEVYYTAPTAQAPDEIKDLLLESSIEDKDGVEPSVNESEEEELFIPEEYYEVIDSIVLFVDNENLGDENPYWDNEYVGGTYELLYYENTKDLICFAFIDIDGDNTAELAILDGSNEENQYRIIDFYAFYDGKVNRVFSGGYRCAYYLTKDLLFCCLGSSSAMLGAVDYSEYDAETHELSLTESYYTSPIGDEWVDGVGLYHYSNSEVEEITIYSSDDSFDLFGDYGVKESDLYVFGEVTTLTEYCESKEG